MIVSTNRRTRLTVEFSQPQTAGLDAFCQKHGVSKADGLRTAIQLLWEYERAKADGYKFGAWSADIEREFVLL